LPSVMSAMGLVPQITFGRIGDDCAYAAVLPALGQRFL
jgi:hypothetical protein